VVHHGSATALNGVSLTVRHGELVALVGPNGAGKSTLVDTLSGVLRPTSGRVHIEGALAHVPEGRQLFADLTVEDNLRLGAWRSANSTPHTSTRFCPPCTICATDVRDLFRADNNKWLPWGGH